jgi:hypothetical protein
MKLAATLLGLALMALIAQNPPPPPPVRIFDPAYEATLAAAAARAAAVLAEPGSIEGIVVEAATGRPVPLATVQLQATTGPAVVGARGASIPSGVIVTTTREDGTFAFKTVYPGIIALRAELGGYIPEMYGTTTLTLLTPPTTLQPGQKLSGVRLALTRGSVISGRLIDDRGEVVVGAVVQTMKTIYKGGLRERQVVQATVSNDLGEYRLFMLRPGEYHVSTLLGGRGQALPYFFPGTIDAKASQPLELREGEALANVNFQAVPTRTRRVTGTVQGHGGDGVSVILSPVNGTAPVQQVLDQTTSMFQFANVAPGAYTLVARSASARSSISIDVRNADVLNMRIALGPGFRIPARARIEGHPPGDDSDLEKVYFIARPDIVVPGLEGETYSPFSNGRFTLELLPGLHHLDITQPQGAYVKSMTLGDVDVLNQGLNVTNSTDQTLEVLVAFNSGSVEGRAAARDATVVLVPDASRRGQRWLFRSMKAGPAGEFRFEKIPPGDYKLFAWTGDGGPWLDPEYLNKYEDRGIPVRVDTDKRTTADRAIPVN